MFLNIILKNTGQKCQETGEKFVPRGGRRQPTRTAVSDSDDAGGHNWSDDSDDDKINNDDMSDLYPGNRMPNF